MSSSRFRTGIGRAGAKYGGLNRESLAFTFSDKSY